MTQNGTDIILMVDGERFAAATANEISLTRAMRDVTNKDSGSWKENEYGLGEGSMNGTGLFLTDSVNLLPFSETLTNASWIKTGLVVDSAKVLGPDGLKNAFNLSSLSNGDTLSSMPITLESLNFVTFSVWVKGIGGIGLYLEDDGDSSTSSNILSSSWQRIYLTFELTSGVDVLCRIDVGDATSLQVYGPQLEYGAEPTAYKPSGKGYSYLSSALINKTKVQCILTNQVDYKLTGQCLVSNLTLTAPMEENVTFTADFSLSGLINEATI